MSKRALELSLLRERFQVMRFSTESDWPGLLRKLAPLFDSTDTWFFSHTPEEISLVCRSTIELTPERVEPNWRCFKVEGPLEFSQTGILAGLTDVLAQSDISVFALSTFDTDYILVPLEQHPTAIVALEQNGYIVRQPREE